MISSYYKFIKKKKNKKNKKKKKKKLVIIPNIFLNFSILRYISKCIEFYIISLKNRIKKTIFCNKYYSIKVSVNF
ncbi:hypothetical protein PFMALIP_04967 [Plasmodium falciparum MaliPS096_E11]|uniref:Uncharacterized protein n=1 Tax=Plasmodium falciparum MaliPS096_E11 TaxID=1036727 RepID=A0A024WJ31_PLAFA|nr:hypothetical protein PFMALIP_04967 [Plasmodium falciparum MaliPS096_E11]